MYLSTQATTLCPEFQRFYVTLKTAIKNNHCRSQRQGSDNAICAVNNLDPVRLRIRLCDGTLRTVLRPKVIVCRIAAFQVRRRRQRRRAEVAGLRASRSRGRRGINVLRSVGIVSVTNTGLDDANLIQCLKVLIVCFPGVQGWVVGSMACGAGRNRRPGRRVAGTGAIGPEGMVGISSGSGRLVSGAGPPDPQGGGGICGGGGQTDWRRRLPVAVPLSLAAVGHGGHVSLEVVMSMKYEKEDCNQVSVERRIAWIIENDTWKS
ncbi:hypothetical protein QBC47DRAFT_388495 [Echria macrotheca]|uniref:Uncharacterized protein n=1 Tax=Echria macrotheca TaxID=438768 RepID=A0AAJ0F3M7_9PEZI|nr:hypothetical protein QBC47DRAFT_388495 [Echria macrotheca]